MLCVGIDISKARFDCALFIKDVCQNKSFSNDKKGFNALFKWLVALDAAPERVFCMEATGVYGVALSGYLYRLGEKVIVANPIKTHAFAKMEMMRNKTDKADALSIARYCQHIVAKGELDKNLFKPKSEAGAALQALVTRLDQLGKQLTSENNRLPVSLNKAASKSIKSMIRSIKQQMLLIESEIKTWVNDDSELSKQVRLLTSIDGIGNKTAWAILAYLGDVSLFDNAKQVAGFAGLNPKITQSGSSINTSSLSKMGHKRLRKSLYMPALVAMRCNPLMRDLYNRLLAKGKPKKVALCAVMRKLLVVSYGVLKSGQLFDVNYAN
jgi:transposase